MLINNQAAQNYIKGSITSVVRAGIILIIIFVSPLMLGQVLVDKRHKFPESGYHPLAPCCFLAPEVTETEKGETLPSEPKKQVLFDDVLGKMSDTVFSQKDFQQAQKVETYIFGLIQRRVLPTRPSRPRTSLAHDARSVSLVRQVTTPEIPNSSKSSEPSAPQVYHDVNQECYPGTGPTEDSPAKYHHHHQESIQHQSGPYHRPRQASHSTLLDYPSFRVLQACPDSSNSEPDSPQHFHCHSPPSLLKAHKPPSLEEQLVKAEYIPAQPCRASTRAYGHPQSNPHRGSAVPKPKQSTYCPERGHHPHPEHQPILSQNQPSRSRGGPKKCRSNEDRGAASRKHGKKACRSQSENSLQRVPERKYNTEEKDGGGRGSHSSQSRNKKQHWQSTLELSQDEAERSPMHTPQQGSSASNHKDHCVRRTRKSRLTHASYIPHHSHHHQHIEYQLERVHVHSSQPNEDYPQPGQGESESSMSEADSPDSSSLSSDSDESGGLVWPQQLAPQNSPPAPPGAPLQPKAFVKIKASHALKKKILRFRTGSLKLMTTV